MATAIKAVEVKRAQPRGWNPRPAGESASAARATVPAPETASDAFTFYVRQNLEAPILRYSQRLKLLKQAQRMGVGRFEANLVIARVLHEQGIGQEIEYGPDQPKGGWMAPLLTFIIVQAAILGGAWWMLR